MMVKKYVLAGGACTALGLTLVALFFRPTDSDPMLNTGPLAVRTGPAGSSFEPPVTARPAQPAALPVGVRSENKLLAELHAGMSSREVLPHYMKLLQGRSPGSFGTAFELYGACLGAMVSATIYQQDRDGLVVQEGPATARHPQMLRREVMARRDAASQEIKRRCEPVLQMGQGDQYAAGDPHAKRRNDALRDLTGNNAVAMFGAAGKELANQGLLFTQANNTLGNPGEATRYFEGKAIKAPSDINAYRLAMALARTEIGLGPTAAPDNLAVLADCAQGASCDGNWQAGYIQYSQVTAVELAKAREMLPRIKAALEANNLDAFRPPKP